MAKPKIFISSTYFDLKQVRADLDRFIHDQGYESVLNELGNIPYGKDDKLESYCYKEINNVDILVSIIGGRYGSESSVEKNSVSQMELKTALELNKQVYIFIEKNIYHEYRFYLENKGIPDVKFTYADNVKIHEFIEFVEGLPNNNTIHGFDNSLDIISFLKEQWSGLFQHFLQDNTKQKEVNIIKGIESTAKTLNQLVTFLTEEKKGTDNTINEILLSNHPAMEQIKDLLNIPYRVFFTNKEEFLDLITARGYRVSDDLPFNDEVWERTKDTKKYSLSFSENLFNEENKLKIYTKEDWKEEYLSLSTEYLEDGDLPF